MNRPASLAACRHLRRCAAPVCLVLALSCTACVSLVDSAADGLAAALADSDDPETVAEALPAYLLLLDGLLRDDPDNPDLLLNAARLYGVYAGVFVADPERARRLTEKARGYAERALCLDLALVCGALGGDLDGFRRVLAGVGVDRVGLLFAHASAWAGWLQAHRDDWRALAQLPLLQASLERVVAIDPEVDAGNALAFLGVLHSQRPAVLGGQPELARSYFERADRVGEGANLMVKVLFARHYARLVFDRELHDRVLAEVVASPTRRPGLTLSNVIAQRQARELLDQAEAYF